MKKKKRKRKLTEEENDEKENSSLTIVQFYLCGPITHWLTTIIVCAVPSSLNWFHLIFLLRFFSSACLRFSPARTAQFFFLFIYWLVFPVTQTAFAGHSLRWLCKLLLVYLVCLRVRHIACVSHPHANKYSAINKKSSCEYINNIKHTDALTHKHIHCA